MTGFFTILSFSLAALSVTNAAQILSVPKGAEVVPNGYIVVMKDDTSQQDFSSHRVWISSIHHNMTRRGLDGAGVKQTYDFDHLRGYSGIFDEDTIKDISNDPKVAFVEPDAIISQHVVVQQRKAPWGLSRLSNRRGGRNYVFDSSAGSGVWAYVVDSGVDIRHSEFQDRAVWGSNLVDNKNSDGTGHGTHVAGTIAGKTYGIAKKAKVVAVKVLNSEGKGPTSGIIAGINWSIRHARKHGMLQKSVLNMSLGGTYSAGLNHATAQAIKAGMFVSVSAGNDNINSNGNSPASERSVCTIAASTENDGKASFSNWGPAVDLYAPGHNILSARPGGGSQTMSGTSMAAPHAAGVAAYLIAKEGIPGNRACLRLKQLSQPTIRNPGPDTTSRLLYNGSGR
ncbi:serine protease [Trichophyton violaceum]|uniref:Serine protease n=1 Tax=Trichophyton violaceum TaxID=34388 RepID=A0A178FAG1_TRIVO|nr:serine protease [Trichophyton violaceum]